MIIKQNTRQQRIKYTKDELYRFYKFVPQLRSEVGKRGKQVTREGHYLNRAYAVDGQFYECITYSGPSISRLEISAGSKWKVRGRINGMSTLLQDMSKDKWTYILQSDLAKKREKVLYKYADFLKKEPWIPEEEDFQLALSLEQARQENLKREDVKKVVDSLPRATWNTQDEELQRALRFQASQVSQTTKKNKR